MHIIRMLFVGLVAGLLARWIYPLISSHEKVPLDLLRTIGLGVVGSLLAGLVVMLVSGDAGRKPFHPAGFLASILGALVVIFVARHFLHVI